MSAVADDWSVFPVAPARPGDQDSGKNPWGGIRWRAESRPREEWNGTWPTGANVGVDCGKSGLVVLDEDEPGAVERWLGYEPVTHTVRTGKGRHFYFRAPEGEEVRNTSKGTIPGLEVRGDGGYVVGAGSVHWTGAVYEVLADLEPARLPAQVLALLPRSADRDRTADVVEVDFTRAPGPMGLPERIEQGHRSSTLFAYASSLVGRGLSDDEALVLLDNAWRRCRLPFTDETPEAMWRRVRTRYRSNADQKFEARVLARLVMLKIDDEARSRLSEEQSAEAASEWFGVTGDQFDRDTPEPVPCVLEYAPGQYAWAPGLVGLFGDRGSAKTWLAYVAVLQEIRRGNRGLIIDYEMSYEESMRRLYTLGMTTEEASRVIYIHPTGAVGDAGRAELLSRIAEGDGRPPTVVVADSMGMGMGMSHLNGSDDADVMAWAYSLPLWLKDQWPGTVIVLIDHVTKGGRSGSTDPIGSQRKGAMCDALYAVEPVAGTISRASRGTARVTVRKDRKGYAEEGSLLLEFEFGGGGPFEFRVPDPDTVSVDLSRVPDPNQLLRKVAVYVGENEGQKVEQVRAALGIQSAVFTIMKNTLVNREAIEHRQRQGLFKGVRWSEYIEE